MDKAIKITLKKSAIGRPGSQRLVLHGLGLTRTGKTVVREDTPEIRGMIRKVIHLVEVQE
ncbi:MAG: 50S ribosomal protein L30 [Deltaproteobacteria bacterium]|jgi:large subunit ribosomal protein L30|nr:50S ribosomal protein L30 [Deltaproteobacteria bacterium]MDP2800202.1 50S ribosomal protein L30 [Deltaproteobacteria bacterium]MDP3029281.1 50S ribosomal protein L30 [Deltaproteobacteria bacterium]TSA10565.1 MAG: 50S ribosomal protein L30 [Deltaproteobacteria bacterium]